MNQGKIIFLNGVSSAGKSVLAAELQKRLAEPFLHFQLDSFIKMLPPTNDVDMFLRMANGMHRSIAAMSEEQNNLIIDHVLIEKNWLDQCLELLNDRYVLFIGLYCPLKELERRERGRDPKRQGFARAQLEKIHKDKIYDLKLNTETLSVQDCALKVLKFYNTKQPTAFDKMRSAE